MRSSCFRDLRSAYVVIQTHILALFCFVYFPFERHFTEASRSRPALCHSCLMIAEVMTTTLQWIPSQL